MMKISLMEAVKVVEKEKRKKEWETFQLKCPTVARLIQLEKLNKCCKGCK